MKLYMAFHGDETSLLSLLRASQQPAYLCFLVAVNLLDSDDIGTFWNFLVEILNEERIIKVCEMIEFQILPIFAIQKKTCTRRHFR